MAAATLIIAFFFPFPPSPFTFLSSSPPRDTIPWNENYGVTYKAARSHAGTA